MCQGLLGGIYDLACKLIMRYKKNNQKTLLRMSICLWTSKKLWTNTKNFRQLFKMFLNFTCKFKKHFFLLSTSLYIFLFIDTDSFSILCWVFNKVLLLNRVNMSIIIKWWSSFPVIKENNKKVQPTVMIVIQASNPC